MNGAFRFFPLACLPPKKAAAGRAALAEGEGKMRRERQSPIAGAVCGGMLAGRSLLSTGTGSTSGHRLAPCS